MNKVTKNWLDDAFQDNNLPSLISKYDVNELINKSMERTFGTYHGFEILLSITALTETGTEKTIKEKDLDEIIIECEKLFQGTPKSDILSLLSIRHVRGLRPPWFSWPIYSEILNPFDDKIRDIFGFSLDEISKDIVNLDPKSELNRFPDAIEKIKPYTTIKHSNIQTPGDLWDKLFVEIKNETVGLFYKISDVAYWVICRELQNRYSKFGDKKGKSLENLVKKEITRFLPSHDSFQEYYIDENEKDIITIGKKMGWAIESKAMNIRPSSADWSNLNAIDDMVPILKGLEQIIPPLDLLKNGGKFIDKVGKAHKIKPKDIVFGFIVTDQIYSSYVRAAIDEVIEKKEVALSNYFSKWHGNQVWIGSIIDLYLLFRVSETPSVLMDYLQWMRSEEKLKYTDEIESWLFYGTEPVMPFVKRVKARIIGSGFGWERVRNEGLNTYFPFWIERDRLIKELDKEGNINQALNIVRQERLNTSRIMKKRLKRKKV